MKRIYHVVGRLFALFLFTPYIYSQQVSLSPTSLTFAPQLVNTVSAPKTVTVTNSGNALLTVSSIAASGGFSITNNCSSLNPGDFCTIQVSFLSGLVGTDKGVITITDNAASSPQIVNLSGSTLPNLTLSPAQVNLGSVAIGMTSQEKPVTLTNHGPALSIAAIAVSGDYLQNNNCPATLSTGASCVITVAFHPTASGTITGALSVTSSDGFNFTLSGVSAALSGVGTGILASQVALQPANLNFGRKGALDFLGHSKTVTLTNTSATSSLSIQSVSLNGPASFSDPIYQIASNTCQGMLAPKAHCQINVAIADSGAFPLSVPGALTIVDSDVTSPQVVGLSATEAPEVNLTPAKLTFAAQNVGTTSSTQVVTVTNNFDDSGVSLLPLMVSGDYSLVAAGSKPCGMSPAFNGTGDSCTVGVTFTPNRVGVINGAVSFTLYPECDPEKVQILHQPCPAAQVINLTGTGQ